MLTYQKYKAAFTTEEEREQFFTAAAKGVPVAPGTAMRHILGTNLGPWGDEQDLLRDAAQIMIYELNTWAKEQGEDTLSLPPGGLRRSATFNKAAAACVAINRREIDALVSSLRTSSGEEHPVDDGPVQQYLTKEFVEALFDEVAKIDDKYERLHRDVGDAQDELDAFSPTKY